MRANCKRWIFNSVVAVLFGWLPFAGGSALAATPCDIELPTTTYVIGQTVEMNVFRLTNPSPTEALVFEWKLWLKSPGLSDISLVNSGHDSSLIIPAGFDVDFASLIGPVQLFVPDGVVFFAGSYELGCRLVNPVTGEEYSDADVIVFDVN